MITSACKLPQYHFKIQHLPGRNLVGFWLKRLSGKGPPLLLATTASACVLLLPSGQSSRCSLRNRRCHGSTAQGQLRTPKALLGTPWPHRHPPRRGLCRAGCCWVLQAQVSTSKPFALLSFS